MSRLITDRRLLLVYACFFAIGMFIWKTDFIWYNSKSQWLPLKQIYLSHSFIFDRYNAYCVIMRFLTGCVASLFFISLFYNISHIELGQSCFAKIAKFGSYTLHVYILQTFFTEINVLNIILPTDNILLFQFLYTPIAALIVTVICIFLARIMERNIYINRYLFGRF